MARRNAARTSGITSTHIDGKHEVNNQSRRKACRCNRNSLLAVILFCSAIHVVFNLPRGIPFREGYRVTDQQVIFSSENHHHLNLQSRNGTLVTLVHIGKTGGSALRDLVDYANGYCEINFIHNLKHNDKTTLQQHMCAMARVTNSKSTGLVHLDRNLHNTLSDLHFLVPVRNPVDRLVSWFYYEKHFQTVKQTRYSKALNDLIHPSRCAFTTANELFLGNKTTNDKQNSSSNDSIIMPLSDIIDPVATAISPEYCYKLSRECLSGALPCYGHNFFNYEYYLEDILVRILKGVEASKNGDNNNIQQEILIPRVDVIRAESSWDDLNRTLLEWTGLPMTADMEFFYLTRKPFDIDTGMDLNTSKEISAEAATRLCETICPELIAYTKILKYAANLGPEEKAKSKTRLERTCGFSIDHKCGKSFRYRNIRDSKKSKLCEPQRRRNEEKDGNNNNNNIDKYAGISETHQEPGKGRHRRLAFLRETKNLPPC